MNLYVCVNIPRLKRFFLVDKCVCFIKCIYLFSIIIVWSALWMDCVALIVLVSILYNYRLFPMYCKCIQLYFIQCMPSSFVYLLLNKNNSDKKMCFLMLPFLT